MPIWKDDRIWLPMLKPVIQYLQKLRTIVMINLLYWFITKNM